MRELVLITGHKQINTYCKASDKYKVLEEYYYMNEVNLDELDKIVESVDGSVTVLFMDDIGNKEQLFPKMYKIAQHYSSDKVNITYITRDLVSQVDKLLIAYDFGVTNIHEKNELGNLEFDYIIQNKVTSESLYSRLLQIKEESKRINNIYKYITIKKRRRAFRLQKYSFFL